jgi:hypothetical protein
MVNRSRRSESDETRGDRQDSMSRLVQVSQSAAVVTLFTLDDVPALSLPWWSGSPPALQGVVKNVNRPLEHRPLADLEGLCERLPAKATLLDRLGPSASAACDEGHAALGRAVDGRCWRFPPLARPRCSPERARVIRRGGRREMLDRRFGRLRRREVGRRRILVIVK